MANIFDYIKWRGDLTLKQSEFNEIDNLILSRFVYFPFDDIMQENEIVSIRELGERFEKATIDEVQILQKEDVDFFPLMAKTTRFGMMRATKYVNKIDTAEEKQFSAITILLPDDTIYVAYRGTDNTIVGWKEDFNLSFKSHVASQLDSVKYLENISQYYSNPIRVGGHSKGGNLAVYASVFVNKDIKDRIINVYNNDGPGFDDEIVALEQYKQIIKKVHTYIPQESIFGRLLNHKEKYTIIESTQKGVMQHDLYTWQLLGSEFIHLKEVTDGSKFVDKTLKDWLIQTDTKQREQLVDLVFQIINTTEAETLIDIKNKWLSNAKIIMKSYKNIDSESKQMVLKTLTSLFKIAKDNLLESNQKNRK